MRTFVAVWPPAELMADLRRLNRPDRAGVRWTTEDQWHVTLRFLGSIGDPGPVVAAVRAAVTGTTVPTATAGPALERLGAKVLCLPVTGLDRLAETVSVATHRFGIPPDPRPFFGHLTLARATARMSRELTGVAVGGRWPVDRISVVRSHLGTGAARYETLAEVSVDNRG